MAGKLLTPTAAEMAEHAPDVAAYREQHAGCYTKALASCRFYHMEQDVGLDDLVRIARPDCPQMCEAIFDYVSSFKEVGHA